MSMRVRTLAGVALLLLCFTAAGQGQVPLRDSLRVFVTDAAGSAHVIVLGHHDEASDDFDIALGESPVPPVPFDLVFDARFVDRPGVPRVPETGAYRDIRKHGEARIDTFLIRVQPVNNAWPVELRWREDETPQFEQLLLRPRDAEGTFIDMQSQSRFVLAHDTRQPILILVRRH